MAKEKDVPTGPNTPAGVQNPALNDDVVLRQQREQSGGLSDDPTDSGAPVRNKDPFKS